jgi:hypothetical protein
MFIFESPTSCTHRLVLSIYFCIYRLHDLFCRFLNFFMHYSFIDINHTITRIFQRYFQKAVFYSGILPFIWSGVWRDTPHSPDLVDIHL